MQYIVYVDNACEYNTKTIQVRTWARHARQVRSHVMVMCRSGTSPTTTNTALHCRRVSVEARATRKHTTHGTEALVTLPTQWRVSFEVERPDDGPWVRVNRLDRMISTSTIANARIQMTT